MNTKRYLSIVLIVNMLLLGIISLSTQTSVNAQSATLSGTSVPVMVIPDTLTLSTDLTLVGQIVPVINTGSDAGLGQKDHDHPLIYLQPFEYYLYDLKGSSAKLSFDEEFYTQFWQQWLDAQARKATIQKSATTQPSRWQDYPKYVTYNALWRDWAGKWVVLTGRVASSGTILAKSLRETEPPPLTTQRVPQGSPIATTSPEKMKGQKITLTGQVIITDKNPPPPPSSLDTGGFRYRFRDTNGKERNVIIFQSPNISTQIRLLEGSLAPFSALNGKWATLTGWLFYNWKPALEPETIAIQLVLSPLSNLDFVSNCTWSQLETRGLVQ